MAEQLQNGKAYIEALSTLTLNPAQAGQAASFVSRLSVEERKLFLSVADSNHVVIRALSTVRDFAARAGDTATVAWTEDAIQKESGRIANAIDHLHRICTALEAADCPTTVMKTLDHWPDMGNDLDLYSTADDDRIVDVMRSKFGAAVEPRSLGDRLAHKWNFAVPGLPEAVEVHVKRLGQTGEHTALAQRFISRRQTVEVLGRNFFVPAPEERIIVATLQRMYRHFYFRVCDLANSAALVESNILNYNELRRISEIAGIWPGVASYLMIVSDHALKYRGVALPLPDAVVRAAQFGGDKTFVRGRFIRVPIMPQGASLYTKQVTTTALRGDVPATFRLNLLPPLAVAAAISFKLTGSDKGIW